MTTKRETPSERSTHSARPPGHLLGLTLARMPELEHFPTSELRAAALSRISASTGNPRDLAAGIVICAGSAAVVMFAVRWGVWWLPLPAALLGWLAELGPWFGALATFFVVMRTLHRRGFQKALRSELIRAGVPICVACGYLLRGLPDATLRCPECGTGIPEDARAILGAAPDQSDPNESTQGHA